MMKALKLKISIQIFQGFVIGSVALVSLALFGAFVSHAIIQSMDVLTPKVSIGLIVGEMIPLLVLYHDHEKCV